MDRQIYNQIVELLKEEVPELRWIDLDMGQLDTNKRPAVAFPCLLVATAINGAKTHYQETDSYGQTCNASITVTLAFDTVGATNSAAPQNVVDNSLSVYNIIDSVQKTLQGLEADNMEPLVRTSQGKKNSRNGLFQYEIRFATTIEDFV